MNVLPLISIFCFLITAAIMFTVFYTKWEQSKTIAQLVASDLKTYRTLAKIETVTTIVGLVTLAIWYFFK